MDIQRVSHDLSSVFEEIDNLHQIIKQRGYQASLSDENNAIAQYKKVEEDIFAFKVKLSALIELWGDIQSDLSEILKVTHGIAERGDRFKDFVMVKLTDGNLNHSYIRVSHYKYLFPEDVFGEGSKEQGVGKPVTLYVDGLSEPVKTDIDGKHGFFRDRKWARKFFKIHHLKPGDKIVIERIAEYEYRVYVPEE
jgi:hypothetical protein